MAITVKHKFVSAIPDGADTSVVRPSNWNDTHDLTGIGTLAEQNANAVAITGGTVSGTTLTSDTVSNNLVFTSTSAPSYAEGSLWYDSTQKALTYYNDVTNNQVHIGQEVQLKVINNTGSSIANGTPVYVTGTSSGQSYPNIALAKADAASTSAVLGLTNGTIASGAVGYVCTSGLLTPCNTGSFTVGQVLYLSPYSAGQLMNTVPPTGYAVQVGVVAYANTPNGSIYIKQTTPLAVSASTIVGQVAVANGGTGASTLTGYVKGSGTSAMTASSTIPNTDISGLGTMSTQNASAVAVTGGTIDNAVIGGTTPAAGTFTTITGQTEVLKGTGENLLTYSNTFSSWTNNNETLTGSQSDPFGGSTATLLVPNTSNTYHILYSNNAPFIAAYPYTISVYVKASGYNLVYLSDTSVGIFACSYNLSTLAVTPYTGCTGTITAVTGATGWYRLTLTTTAATTTSSRVTITGYPAGATLNQFNATFAGDGTSGIVIYGAMAEFGSVANTYISTTSTAVYGTPTLSFSGVAGLGLQSDGSLYVSPAGTGAIQAQATTSSTVGGNARGANSTDFQTARNNANQVASGPNAFIGGGIYNSVTSALGGVSVGGGANAVSGYFANNVGGYNNSVSGSYAASVGGYANTNTGYFSFLGGGYGNSTPALAAVTTQNGTMNGTTAVTLSGSNASIKVGQLVFGTYIPNFAYVAAISGTSLTLSQAASGSGTATLSFYTPHGVVVGGGNNQATGSYSFIGGGGDAGTSGNRNVASGDWSVVAGGIKNTSTGLASVIVGGGAINGLAGNSNAGQGAFMGAGAQNSLDGSSTYSAIIAGALNQITSDYSSIGGGYSNQVSARAGFVGSGFYGTTRGIVGNNIAPASANPMGSNSQGTQQAGLLIIARQTTDATPTVLASNTASAGSTNQVILPNNSAYYFTGEIVSGVTGGGNSKGWTISGLIKRGANAGATTLVGSTVTSLYADVGASTWTIALSADTSNGGLAVTFTGQASTTIRTVAQIRTTEMTY